jgi:hypothetical protein
MLIPFESEESDAKSIGSGIPALPPEACKASQVEPKRGPALADPLVGMVFAALSR